MTVEGGPAPDKKTRDVRRVGRRLLKRTLTTLPVLWLVVTVVFLLIHLVPGDPIVQMLGEGATAADIAALRHQLWFDLPLRDAVHPLLARDRAWGSGAVAAAA